MVRIKVPKRSKELAKKALELRKQLPKSKKFGLNKEEAKKLGITSGVERAKKIIKSKTISEKEAKSIGRFYDRFKNKKGKRAEGSFNLWGGRKFAKRLSERF